MSFPCWIPVSSAPTGENTSALVFCDGFVMWATWIAGEWVDSMRAPIAPTHWMGLPDAPGVTLEQPRRVKSRRPGVFSWLRDRLEPSVGWVLRKDLVAEVERAFPEIPKVKREAALTGFLTESHQSGRLRYRAARTANCAVIWTGPTSSTENDESRKRALGIG